VKAADAQIEKSELEQRVEQLEQWQAQFSLDVSKQFAASRSETNKKSSEIRQRLQM